MSILDGLLGRRPFAEKSDIIDFVSNSMNFEPGKEDLSKADALLIFKTSKQQTWLVSSSERMYCILDDRRFAKPNINWSMDKNIIAPMGQINLSIRTKDKSSTSGLVDIGPERTNWYFSKCLFSNSPIDKSITDLVNKTMLKVDKS